MLRRPAFPQLSALVFLLSLNLTLASSQRALAASADEQAKFEALIEQVTRPAEPVSRVRRPESATPLLPASSAGLKTLEVRPEVDEPRFKTDGDLYSYLNCYLDTPNPGEPAEVTRQRHEKVRKVTATIDSVARTVGLPKTFLACLIFRESKFDPDAVSESGALGLSQVMPGKMVFNEKTKQQEYEPGTIDHLNNIIKPVSAARLKANQIAMTQTLAEYQKKKYPMFRLMPEKTDRQKKAKAAIATRIQRQYEDAVAAANARALTISQSVMWQDIYKNLRVEGNSVTAPKELDATNVKNPINGVAITGLYVRDILIHIKQRVEPQLRLSQPENENPNYYQLLFAAGCYNMGPGACTRAVGNIEPPQFKRMVEKLKALNEETHGHIVSIDRCARAASSSGGEIAWQAPNGSRNVRNCQAPAADRRVESGRINRVNHIQGGGTKK